MGWTDGETAIRDFATLACQARKCTFYRARRRQFDPPPRSSRSAMPALTIYWRSKRFFQWRRPFLSLSGPRSGEFAPRRGAQERLVAGDGAQPIAKR